MTVITRWARRWPRALPVLLGVALVLLGYGGGTMPLVSTTPYEATNVMAWGTDDVGSNGEGPQPQSLTTPVPVAFPYGVRITALASGTAHAVAIGSDRKLYAWGANRWGQVGDRNGLNKRRPVTVALPRGVHPVAVAAGDAHTLMLGSDNRLWALGGNDANQLGTVREGWRTVRFEPVALPSTARVAAMSAAAHNLVITTDRRLYSWGFNRYGQLGDGTRDWHTTPVEITLAPGVHPVAVSAGSIHSLAIGSDRRLYAWGANHDGGLGTGDTRDRHRPTPIQFPSGVYPVQVATLLGSSLAIGSDGQLYGWGYGYDGVLGDADVTAHQVRMPQPLRTPPGVRFTAVSGRLASAVATSADGRVFCWGNNHHGQLGDGTRTVRSVPTAVSLPGNRRPLAVTAGHYRALVLTE